MTTHLTLVTRTGCPPVGTSVTLVKEPTNTFDNEAIAVYHDTTKTGYVSATYKTRLPNTISAGRIYDKFDSPIPATITAPNILTVVLP